MDWKSIDTYPPPKGPAFLIASQEDNDDVWYYDVGWWEAKIREYISGVTASGAANPMPKNAVWTPIISP